MKFQFKNNQGNVISINEIDAIAAAFWGQEVDPKYYAQPKVGMCQNWLDIIGWAIALYPEKNSELCMDTVAAYMLFTQSKWGGDKFSTEYFKEWVDTLDPYIQLCRHLQDQGMVAISL